MKRFEEILDTCLTDIKSGKASVEDCLKRHPELKDELEPLLRIAMGLPRLPEVAPSQEFRRRARIALSEEMERRSLLSRLGNGLAGVFRPARLRVSAAVLAVILAVVVVFGSGGAVAYASQASLPGDPLYPVKTATEQGRLLVTFGPAAKANYHLELAQRRVDEAVALANAGRPIDPATVEAVATQVDTALANLQNASPEQTQAILGQFSSEIERKQVALAEAKKHANDREAQRLDQTEVLVQRGQAIAKSISEDPSRRDQPVSVKAAQKGEVKGTVSSLNPLVIGGTQVSISPDTEVDGTLAMGKVATAKGVLGADGVLQAASIEVQDGGEATAVHFRGAISSINPLIVAGRKVVLAPDSKVKGVLQVGLIADVEGKLQQDSSVLASHIEVERLLQEVLQGTVTSLQPLKVGDTVVTLAPDAKVEGSLRVGATARATGSYLDDGTFQASLIKVNEGKTEGGKEDKNQDNQGQGKERQDKGQPPTPKESPQDTPVGGPKPTQTPPSGQQTPTPTSGGEKPTQMPPVSGQQTPTPPGSTRETPTPAPTVRQPTPVPRPGKQEEQKEGTIISIAGNDVTVEVNKNDRFTVKVTADTEISIDDSRGGIGDLRVGGRAKVKYDPGTGIASEIEQRKADSNSGPKK